MNMPSSHHNVSKIVTFLVITFGLRSIFYTLIISAGKINTQGGLYLMGLMWSPGIAGLVTQLLYEHSLRHMGWLPGKAKYLWLGYLLPVCYGLVMYGIVWLTGLGGFSLEKLAQIGLAQTGLKVQSSTTFALVYLLILILVGTISSIVSALGEEIGWRGVLVPELAKTSTFTKTALISGLIWTLWHIPVLLFADYNTGTPAGYALVCFAVSVVGLSFAFAWLRLKSGSLWHAILLHASHNLFIKNIYTALTTNTGVTNYVIDEFGIGLVLVAIALAIIFWRKRDELLPATGTAGGQTPHIVSQRV
jgi:membrane protease YdiL (CAAX protease family)